ncbi:MAG: FtsW/RodA/SpoVE family cell cycle protein [Candidatus Taylorbacteria bacterium]|nr:FtsW/RodA/SpoVE family cell cycle protein [Candidatus Taylorbacteria bacterium]
MSSSNHIDKFFLFTTAAITIAGFVIFLSASLGLLSQTGAAFGSVAIKQSISLVIGAVAFFLFSRFKYTFFRKTATIILIAAVLINLLLFIPSLALHFNGASRWIDFGIFSFQPSEFLKIASVIYFAAWLHFAKDRIKRMKFGLLPYIIIMAILGTLLLIQSDTDTLVIIGFTGIIMFMIAGMPFRHLVLSLVLLGIVVAGVIYFRPYAMERFKVYLNPTANTHGSAYQINQSLIAIGSGGMFGRGFGQSIQKFGYLPQPTDDSIFAVAAEEFGLVGGAVLLLLYCLFALSSFRIGNRSPDVFGGMLAIGFAVLVVTESFLNMAAMLGLVPISGLPLLFVSHGGTALIITLAGAGIVANVSKYPKGA